ncbi:hypothetical protein AWH49_16850 [Domibacillus aminovorans]|uniref:Uncharacterized protein n=1 Tax=Domibacillus aminovorans TaxID=29332 RepID=A0A177L3V2_9BACI|nr:hypothetical protein AWH49_16850 [Domibacillus aminovorans]
MTKQLLDLPLLLKNPVVLHLTVQQLLFSATDVQADAFFFDDGHNSSNVNILIGIESFTRNKRCDRMGISIWIIKHLAYCDTLTGLYVYEPVGCVRKWDR